MNIKFIYHKSNYFLSLEIKVPIEGINETRRGLKEGCENEGEYSDIHRLQTAFKFLWSLELSLKAYKQLRKELLSALWYPFCMRN